VKRWKKRKLIKVDREKTTREKKIIIIKDTEGR